MRVPSEAKNCIQTDINGVRYTAKRGFFDMPDDHAKAHLKSIGEATPASAGTATKKEQGFRCPVCGFGSWFNKCSRCGGDCEKESE
jgi:hypothetical protein